MGVKGCGATMGCGLTKNEEVKRDIELTVVDGMIDMHARKCTRVPDLSLVPRIEMVEELNACSNQIPSISQQDLGPLANLVRLNLAYNVLEFISDLSSLQFLEVLDLQHNQLTEIPKDIHLCPSLRDLNLESNKLVTLHPDIGQCRALRRLNVSDNHLKAFPIELCNLNLENGGLEWQNGAGNPDMIAPPPEVRELGQQAIFEWLRKQAEIEHPLVKERKQVLTRLRKQEEEIWLGAVRKCEYDTQEDYEEQLLMRPKWMPAPEAMEKMQSARLGGGWWPPDDYSPPNPFSEGAPESPQPAV